MSRSKYEKYGSLVEAHGRAQRFIDGLGDLPRSAKDRPEKPNYTILCSAETYQDIGQYQHDLGEGDTSVGFRLLPTLGLKAKSFIEQLLGTKPPRIFAESAVKGNGDDWTPRELSLLGDIGVAVPVTIHDNGAWSAHQGSFAIHDQPVKGHLLFTAGALLRNDSGSGVTPPDQIEITNDRGEIDQSKYNALVERRALPLLVHANETAKQESKRGVVTVPGIGCGQFAGQFQGQMGERLDEALQAMLKKHADKLDHIACIHYDSFKEGKPGRQKFANVTYQVNPSEGTLPLLSAPHAFAQGGEDYSDCTLFKIVAWDHVSLPGNDFFNNDRATDDGVSAAATNVMTAITGIPGRYDAAQGKYLPAVQTPDGRPRYTTWEDGALAWRTALRADEDLNVRVVTPDGQYLLANAVDFSPNPEATPTVDAAEVPSADRHAEGNDAVMASSAQVRGGNLFAQSTQYDAIFLPQFRSPMRMGLTSQAIRQGMEIGQNAYEHHVAQAHDGMAPGGSAHVTITGREDIAFIVHGAIIDDADRQGTAQRIKQSVKEGLHQLTMQPELQDKTPRLAVPPLGMSNGVTAEQSATAIFSALKEHLEETGRAVDMTVVVYNDPGIQSTFNRVLSSDAFANLRTATTQAPSRASGLTFNS